MGLRNEYEVESHSTDPEKGPLSAYAGHSPDSEKGPIPAYVDEAPAVPGEVFITGDTLYARIQRAVSKFGVEPRGIERVPENERTDTNLRKVGTMVSGPAMHFSLKS